jgi:hypothetical protein
MKTISIGRNAAIAPTVIPVNAWLDAKKTAIAAADKHAAKTEVLCAIAESMQEVINDDASQMQTLTDFLYECTD